MKLPFNLETASERLMATDREWLAGIEWGAPRSGHPEGAVKWHIAQVLDNLENLGLSETERARLRLAALSHDTFKYKVDRSAPRIVPNEHGFLATRWLIGYSSDRHLLALVELHDDGYRAWQAAQNGREEEAWELIKRIIDRMEEEIGLFVAFYRADNASGDKSPEQIDWFVARLKDCGIEVSCQ